MKTAGPGTVVVSIGGSTSRFKGEVFLLTSMNSPAIVVEVILEGDPPGKRLSVDLRNCVVYWD